MPPDYEAWWRAWQRQLPSYEFVTWTDRDIGALPAVAAKIAEAQGMARKGDIARYDIIRQEGGVYLDCDIMPLNFYDPRSDGGELIVCSENANESMCSIGFFAASRGCETLGRAVEAINGKRLNQAPPNVETGPWLFGGVLNAANPESRTKLPPDSFYPYGYEEPFSHLIRKDLAATYGIHVWGGSWLPDERHMEIAIKFLDCGDLHEAERTLNKLRSTQKPGKIIATIESIRSIRDSIRKACLSGNLANRLSTTETSCFELFKTCKYLLESEPDTLFWNIGAGDGIAGDSLRPVMINYDPKSVFPEPDPSLFQKLKENYARNRNILFLETKFGADIDQPETKAARGIEENTTAIGVDTLHTAGGSRGPDLLALSSRAADPLIIEQLLSRGMRPKIIHCDQRLMDEERTSRLRVHLKNLYVTVEKEGLATAYRKDFLLSYCSHIFVEHGIQSIFKNALPPIFGR